MPSSVTLDQRTVTDAIAYLTQLERDYRWRSDYKGYVEDIGLLIESLRYAMGDGDADR